MKFVFLIGGICYIVEADNKHMAITKFVEKEHNNDMADFYYGYDDGAVTIYEVKKEI